MGSPNKENANIKLDQPETFPTAWHAVACGSRGISFRVMCRLLRPVFDFADISNHVTLASSCCDACCMENNLSQADSAENRRCSAPQNDSTGNILFHHRLQNCFVFCILLEYDWIRWKQYVRTKSIGTRQQPRCSIVNTRPPRPSLLLQMLRHRQGVPSIFCAVINSLGRFPTELCFCS